MPKHLWILLLTSIVHPFAVAADLSEYSCEYEFKRYGMTGGANVTVNDGKIQKIEHFNHQHVTNEVDADGYPLRLGFNCSVYANRGDKEEEWRDNGRTITVEYAKDSLMDGSVLAVTQTARGFLIDMSRVRHDSVCGANAETPITLYLPKNSKRCQVRIRSYLYDLSPGKPAP